MKRTRSLALAVGLAVLGIGPDVWACGCTPIVDTVPAPTLEMQVASWARWADYIFLGSVGRREAGAPVFTIEAYWKGTGGVEFAMSGSATGPDGIEQINDCEVYFEDRVKYVVFVQRTTDGRLIASQCGFTRRVADATDVLSALDRSAPRREPRPR